MYLRLKKRVVIVNKIDLFVLFIIIVDIMIVLLIDSVYCQKEIWLILLGIIGQSVMVYLLIHDILPSKKISFDNSFSKEEAVVVIFICFFAVYNGSLGTDITGRTTQCPNTWLLYLQEFL